MAGITDITMLLQSMEPTLQEEEYVFCSVQEDVLLRLQLNPLLQFKEKEGLTLIIEKRVAERHSLQFEMSWRMITLNVHSDLAAVGFLAAISSTLAKNDISLNAVSAYYHDHLFVPSGKEAKAMQLLKRLSISSIPQNQGRPY